MRETDNPQIYNKQDLGPRPDLIRKGFIYEGFNGLSHTYRMEAGGGPGHPGFVERSNIDMENFWTLRRKLADATLGKYHPELTKKELLGG